MSNQGDYERIDVWTAMAERMRAESAQWWERDRAFVRSWLAGGSLMRLVALGGREIVDVCRTL